MHTPIPRNQNPRQQILLAGSPRFLRAARHGNSPLVTELAELLAYLRKTALRVLRPKPVLARTPPARVLD